MTYEQCRWGYALCKAILGIWNVFLCSEVNYSAESKKRSTNKLCVTWNMPEDSPQDSFIKRKYRLIFLAKPLTWSRLSFLIKQMFFFIEIDKYTYLAIKVWRNCILKTYLLRTRCIMSKSLNWSEMIVDALGLGSHCLQVIRDRRLSCWAVGTWGQSPPQILADTLTLF